VAVLWDGHFIFANQAALAEHVMTPAVSNSPLPEVATMFNENLLESSSIARGKKRWPMTLAFVLEIITVSFLLIVPLMSTGVIPVMAHVPLIAPVHSVEIVDHPASETAGSQGMATGPSRVIRVVNNPNALRFGEARTTSDQSVDPFSPISDERSRSQIGDLMCTHECVAIARPAEPRTRLRLSHLSEASLVHKVDPIYPHTAVITHTSGEVQLHAIISKDGSIQSLSVTKGNPILAQAAVEAVQQWRYRPYLLNDEAVEVETFITVNFRAGTN
jgi:periplasmic protein TonB